MRTTDRRPHGRRGRRRPHLLSTVGFAVAALIFVAYAAVVSMARPADGAIGALELTAVDATEVESYTSLEEMTRAADAVVLGRIAVVDDGRVFGEAADLLHYAAATVEVDEVLAGSLPSHSTAVLTLEIPLFNGRQQLETLQSALPGQDGLFFLRNKGTSARIAGEPLDVQLAESRFHRLVVFRGVVLDEDGRGAVLEGPGDFIDDLGGVDFATIVSRVRAATP